MRAALIAGALLLSFAGSVSAGDQVPFHGSLAGTATVTPLAAPFASVLVEAAGTATQLGSYTLEFPHVVNQATRTGVGTYTFTSANGDTLSASGTGLATLVSPGVLTVSEQAIITGGTGRFAGASGSFTVERTFYLAAGETSGTFSGWISTPGS